MIITLLTITACSGDKEADTTGDATATDTDVTTEGDTTSDTTDPTQATDTEEEPFVPVEVDYSVGLDDNGHLAGIKALDYLELPVYKGIAIPADDHTVSDDVVQSEIASLLSQYSTTERIMDRAIVDGDTVNIDFVGSVDGVEFDGGNTGGAGADVTIGVTSYIDDFLAQLIGHTPGEAFDIEVTFPEDYGQEDLNGKDAVFAITINSISETKLPELNNQFVTENLAADYQWTSVDEMTEGIKTAIETSKANSFIQTYLLDNSTFTSVPEEAITYQENVMLNYYKSSANSYGMDVDSFLQISAQVESADALIEVATEEIAQAANFGLIIQAIAEDATIEITEDDIAAYFLENAGTSDYTQFTDQYGMAYIKNSLLQDAVLEYVKDKAELE